MENLKKIEIYDVGGNVHDIRIVTQEAFDELSRRVAALEKLVEVNQPESETETKEEEDGAV